MEDKHLKEYKKIINVLVTSFIINIILILAFNLAIVNCYLTLVFGNLGLELIKQFFYGSIGATIACTLFLAKDKDINELESLKEKPDPKVLRLPDSIDRKFYSLRIATSGLLAIVGAIVILTGFSYLEIDYDQGFSIKQKLLFALASFLIGLYQFKFLNRIENVFNSLFKGDTIDKNESDTDSKPTE